MDLSKILSPEVLTYLAKQTPFGVFCIFIIIILCVFFHSSMKQMHKSFELSLKTIQDNYDQNLKFLTKALEDNTSNKIKKKNT